jgi:hypothetical protein
MGAAAIVHVCGCVKGRENCLSCNNAFVRMEKRHEKHEKEAQKVVSDAESSNLKPRKIALKIFQLFPSSPLH